MMGVGPSFQEQQWDRVQCPDCRLELVSVLLAFHHQAQHENESPPQWASPLTTLGPRLYMVSFPRASRSIGFPVGY